MDSDKIVIVAAKRTAIGSFMGVLSSLSAVELAAISHRAAIEQAGIAPELIDEVIGGCVLQAGLRQAPARQAAIAASVPVCVPATTLNKICGSGMKAVMLGNDLIKAGSANIVLAGGMESMSNAPYLLNKARSGYRLGHGEIKDHMFLDGLEDAYEQSQLMGYFAEKTASHFSISREQQDDYARLSLTLALRAQQEGAFFLEIADAATKGSSVVSLDEGPNPDKLAKIARLRPAFKTDGTITAANSSSIADGAASLILMKSSLAKKLKIKPLAKIIAHATHAQEPEWFTTAPAPAIRKVLDKAGWEKDDVDLFEINEAFAVVAMVAIAELGLNPNKVNIHGGACALGHPIGASGARILVTLLYALARRQQKRGVASLCIGGGEATAMAIEIC